MAKLLMTLARHLERQGRRRQKEAQREERHTQQEAHREAKLRQKDLELRMKEHARLSVLEQARLEVEAFENGIEVLLSIHKEAVSPIDWQGLAATLLPCPPSILGANEFEVRLLVAEGANEDGAVAASLCEAHRIDAEEHATLHQAWVDECLQSERERSLARRVLAGDLAAYVEAVAEFSGLGEVKQLGLSFEVIAHNAHLIECRLAVNGWEVVPKQVLSLTSSGKLSVKATPKARFHEIYQDHVCSCVLRVARAVLAVLPIDTVLVTASVLQQSALATSAGVMPILSAAFPRAKVDGLPFDTLDPSDALEGFFRRGDVRASRKSGEFVSIAPLRPVEVEQSAASDLIDLSSVLLSGRKLRDEINALRATFTRQS